MPNRPLVIQFSIVDGDARETSPGVGIFDSAPEANDPYFYILTEMVPPAEKHVSEQLMSIAEDAFSAHRASVTSRLRRALSGAQRWLADENQRRLPEQRVLAGVTCAAIQDDNLYLAQAGPSLAFLRDSDGLRLIRAAGAPMGGPGDVDITLRRHALQQGDVLLVASSSLEDLAPLEMMASLLRAGPLEAMQRVYVAARGEAHFSALLIAPGESATHPPAPRKARAARQSVPGRIWRYVSPMLAAFFRHMLPVMGALLGLLLYPIVALLRFVGAMAHGIKTLAILEEEEPAEPQRQQGQASSQAGQKSKSLAAPQGRAISLPLLALVILAILIAGGLGALYLPGFLAQQTEIRFATLVTQAEVLYQRGTAAADRDESRKYLRESSSQVNNALAIHADDARALELRQKLDAALEKVDALFQLSGVKMVMDGATLRPAARDLLRILVQDNVLYLFDRGASGAYVFSLDADGNPKMVESPGFVPATGTASEPPSDTVEMLLMPPGDSRPSGGVLFFDKNRSLTEYDMKRGFRPLIVRGPWEWASFEAARGYAGNLYVLDSKSRQVWRYIPTDAGYDSEMKPLLEDVDMGDAFDFAIDGNIYILNRLGQVFKFSGGQLQRFTQQGLDRPLSTPGAIFGTLDTKSIYVADTGNKRVVTFDKDGRFQRQLVSSVIDSPRSIFVDERRGRIYILSGNKLYLAGLPK